MYYFFLKYKVFPTFVIIFLGYFMKKITSLSIILLVSLYSFSLPAQDKNGLEKNADMLHKTYRFNEALLIYRQLLENTTDSLARINLENKIIFSENGKNLLEFASEPRVIEKKNFGKNTFFLHYPGFPDGSWVEMPRGLAPQMPENEKAVIYFLPESEKLIYSAPDDRGSWNLYMSRFQDSTWSAPQLLNENITSAGNEIYPYLSPDSKTLYFSSDGHYGVGGYDLYVSQWDEDLNDWGVPQNLGFPYSSPADDFFYYNTPDGLYTLFASGRDVSPDSVTVYVLEFENMPVKKSVTEDYARQIARLKTDKPDDNTARPASGNTTGADNRGEEYSEYNKAVTLVRQLRQDIAKALDLQKANRELYNTLTNPDDLAALEKKIGEEEARTLALQDQLNSASRNLQQIEMDFLSKGIILSQEEEKAAPQTPSAQTGAPLPFAFADNRLGRAPEIRVNKPEPVLDPSFKILDEAVIADIEDFPSSLTYQIQLFVLSKEASLKALKGLSPVFVRKTGTRYSYAAGIFHTYGEALSNLNKVRKLGFTTAVISAYNEGKSLPVKNARILEKKLAETAVYQIVIDGYPDGLPDEVLKVIRDNTEKDIAKTTESGAVKFVIGPFGKQEEARSLSELIRAVSGKPIDVEKVENR